MKNIFLKHWKKIAVILVILLVSVFFIFRSKSKIVKTSTIQKGGLKEEMILSGDINAINFAKMTFETSGKIVYVGVKEGDKVFKGKLLSKLDTTVLNSSYQSALLTLRTYQATVDNIHDQVKGHDSDETFAQKDLRTTAESNKDKAYEAVIVAKRNLDGASLYAPFNGIVTYVAHPFSGVYTSVASTEIEIIDPSTMYMTVLADQTEVTKLQNGQSVSVVLDPFEDKEFEGIIENISFTPKLGESGSVYSIKVAFKNVNLEKSSFKIAMTGDAKFVVSQKDDVLFVPSNFVKQDKNGNFVKVNKKGEKIYITTGIESENDTEIIGEIKEGQVVYD